MATIYDLVADVNNETAQKGPNGFHRLTHKCVCTQSHAVETNVVKPPKGGWMCVLFSTMMTVCSTEKELHKRCGITSMHFVVLLNDLSQVSQKQEVPTSIQDLNT